jgi:hypothetical protein
MPLGVWIVALTIGQAVDSGAGGPPVANAHAVQGIDVLVEAPPRPRGPAGPASLRDAIAMAIAEARPRCTLGILEADPLVDGSIERVAWPPVDPGSVREADCKD